MPSPHPRTPSTRSASSKPPPNWARRWSRSATTCPWPRSQTPRWTRWRVAPPTWVGTRGSSPEQLDRYFEVTQRLGARILRVVLSDAEEGRTLDEERAVLQALLPRLAEAGIALALENRFRLTPDQMADLIRSLDAPNAGACLDPLNSVSCLIGPREAIRALAPLAVTAHVKSATMRREGAIWVLRGCPVGEGLLDVEELVSAVRANGRTPPPNLLAEGWMEPLETEAATLAQEEDWTRRGIAYLKDLVLTKDEGRPTFVGATKDT
jgi:sugar phosphate isomerase/epimerase